MAKAFKRLVSLLALSVMLCAALPGGVQAAAPAPAKESGLLITPIRQFLSANAGKTLKSSLTVANLTSNPLSVSLSVQQFSVTDYVYNYTFSQPANDWLRLSVATVSLRPGESADVPYTVDVPAGSTPGGRYYTLFASATVSSQGVNSTIQAADLLYLTINGKLTRTSHLQGSSIPWISFGRSIPFSLQPVNTGNVYFFASVSGQLHGLFVRPPIAAGTHLLMPDKVRAIQGSIPSPVLPGIYRATYGYKTDGGQSVTQAHLVVFIPPWFIAFVLAGLLIAGKLLPRRKRPGSQPEPGDKL